MRGSCWNCCSPIVSRASGFPRRPSGILVNCWCIVTSWLGWRTQVRNQLSALAGSQGVFSGTRFWTQAGRPKLESLSLDRWAAQRRQGLLRLLDDLDAQIADLTRQIEQQARARNNAVELMRQDGVGPIVSLAFVLTLGTAQRFPRGKQVAGYLGLNPSEHSSGGTQRFGHISKQGNRMMRWLLVEAAWMAVRKDPELQRVYQRLAFRRGRKIAAVAVARKLAVKLYWRLREFEQNNAPQSPAPMQGSSSQRTDALIDSVIGHPASLRSRGGSSQ